MVIEPLKKKMMKEMVMEPLKKMKNKMVMKPLKMKVSVAKTMKKNMKSPE